MVYENLYSIQTTNIKMFILSDLQHTVKIFPEEMNIKMEDRIIDK